MQAAIDKPQESLSPHAPRLLSFRIDTELIGTVIGPGGRTIKGITERTNTKIDIEDGGIVTIASHDGAAAEEAQKIIEGLTRKVHEGEIFSGGGNKNNTYRCFRRNITRQRRNGSHIPTIRSKS